MARVTADQWNATRKRTQAAEVNQFFADASVSTKGIMNLLKQKDSSDTLTHLSGKRNEFTDLLKTAENVRNYFTTSGNKKMVESVDSTIEYLNNINKEINKKLSPYNSAIVDLTPQVNIGTNTIDWEKSQRNQLNLYQRKKAENLYDTYKNNSFEQLANKRIQNSVSMNDDNRESLNNENQLLEQLMNERGTDEDYKNITSYAQNRIKELKKSITDGDVPDNAAVNYDARAAENKVGEEKKEANSKVDKEIELWQQLVDDYADYNKYGKSTVDAWQKEVDGMSYADRKKYIEGINTNTPQKTLENEIKTYTSGEEYLNSLAGDEKPTAQGFFAYMEDNNKSVNHEMREKGKKDIKGEKNRLLDLDRQSDEWESNEDNQRADRTEYLTKYSRENLNTYEDYQVMKDEYDNKILESTNPGEASDLSQEFQKKYGDKYLELNQEHIFTSLPKEVQDSLLELERSNDNKTMDEKKDYLGIVIDNSNGRDLAGLDINKEYANKIQQEKEDIISKYNLSEKDASNALAYSERIVNQERAEKERAKWEEFGDEHPILGSIVSVPMSLMQGAGVATTFWDKLQRAIGNSESPIDYNSTSMRIAQNTNALRSGAAPESEVGKFVYDTFMSTVDSAATLPLNYVVPGATTIILGSSAATSTLLDAHEKGASDSQALLTSIGAGIFEGFFEKFSLDKMVKMGNGVKNIKSFLANTAKSMGIEGSEEGFTEIANIVMDNLVNGELSDYSLAVENYKQQGYTKSEAESKARTDMAVRIAENVGGGMLGGAFFSAPVGAFNYAQNKAYRDMSKKGQKIIDNGIYEEMEEHIKNNYSPESELYQQMLNTDKQDSEQVGFLANTVEVEKLYQATDGYWKAAQPAISERLQELNVPADEAERIAYEKVNNMRTGIEAEIKLGKYEDAFRQVEEEIKKDVKGQETAISDKIDRTEQKLYANEYEQVKKWGAGESLRPQIDKTAEDTVKKNIETKQAEGKIITEGKSYLISDDNTRFDVTSIVVGTDGKTKVNTNTNQTYNIDDVAVDREMAVIDEFGKNYTVEQRKNFFRSYNEQRGNVSAVKFASCYEQAYQYGLRNMGVASAMRNTGLTSVLTTDSLARAYSAGKMQFEKNLKEQTRGITKGAEKGKVKFDNVVRENLNETQKAAVGVAEILSDVTGVNYEFFESNKDEKGNYKGENGSYNRNTNTIRIDVNAGMKNSTEGNNIMVVTLAHELTHYIESFSPEQYAKLQEFAFSRLSEVTGQDINELIHLEKERIRERRKNLNQKQVSEEKLTEEAKSELVARSFEGMLTDAKAVKQLAQQDVGLFNKLKNKVMEFVSKIEKACRELLDNNGKYKDGTVSKEARELQKYAKEMREIWVNALKDAGENVKTVESSGSKYVYSDRESFEKQVDKAVNGEWNSLNALYVSDTPKLLLNIGLKQLPMLYTKKHLTNALKQRDDVRHQHGLTVEQIKLLPEIVEHPAIVMDSLTRKDSIIVVSDKFSDYGEPLMASIKIDGEGMYELQSVKSNFITSMYGKGGIEEFINNAVKKDAILYIDNKKSQNLFSLARVQFPRSLNKYDFDTILRQSNHIVNTDVRYQDRNISDNEGNELTKQKQELTTKYKQLEQEINKLHKRQRLQQTQLQEFENSKEYNDALKQIAEKNSFREKVESRKLFEDVFNKEKELRDAYVESCIQERKLKNQLELMAEKIEELEKKELLSGDIDEKYIDLINSGKMDEAATLVKKYAESKGYIYDKEYRDAHRAPGNDGLVEDAIKNGEEYEEGDVNIKHLSQGISPQPDDYFSVNGARWYGYGDKAGMESYKAIKEAIEECRQGKTATVKVYRAVPNDIKEGKLRNDDWVTPSKTYAINHGESRFGENSYRIIEDEVAANELWWDGNDIREWGYDNSREEVYKNVKNNVKLLATVTYDDKDNMIPLSKRFNQNNEDIRYQDRNYSYDKLVKKPDMTVTKVRRDYRHLSVSKCIDVILSDLKKEKDRVERRGNTAVKNIDSGDYILVTKEALRHGISSDRTGATRLISCNIADAIRNGIKVNVAEGKRNNADSAYIIMGKLVSKSKSAAGTYYYRMAVNRYEENNNGEYYIDDLYAIKAQKERTSPTSTVGAVRSKNSDTFTGSKISVADFLNEVKDFYGNELSEDVNNHFGRTRGQSDIEGLMFQERNTEPSNREILATALKTTAVNDIEREKITKYQKYIDELNDLDKKYDVVESALKDLWLSFYATGKKETSTIEDLTKQKESIRRRIKWYDKQLLDLESTTALKNLLEREKTAAVRKQRQVDSEKLKAYRKAQSERFDRQQKRYQDMARHKVENRRRIEARNKVIKRIDKLNAYLEKPDNKKYIPAGFMQSTVSLLKNLNQDVMNVVQRVDEMQEKMAGYEIVPEKMAEQYEKLMSQKNDLEKRTQRLSNLYAKIENDPLFGGNYSEVVQEQINKMLEVVEDDKPIGAMNVQELNVIKDTIDLLTNEITKWKETLDTKFIDGNGNERSISEISKEVHREIMQRPARKDNIFKNYTTQQLTPERMFKLIGGYTKNGVCQQIGEMLNQGQLDKLKYEQGADAIFNVLLDEKDNRKKLNKMRSYKKENLVDIGLTDEDGNSVKITRGMMIAIALHLENEQNRRHAMYGGFTVPELSKYYNNQQAKSYAQNKRRVFGVSPELAEMYKEIREAVDNGASDMEIAELEKGHEEIIKRGELQMAEMKSKIESLLSDYDRKWIKCTREYFDNYSKNAINEVTMKRYGMKKAGVDNYFPIHTDSNYLSSDAVGKGNMPLNLENAGFMKDRVKSAKPIYLEDIVDVINNSITTTGTYVGFLIPQYNYNKIMGYTANGYKDNISTALDKKFGRTAKDYLGRLEKDLFGGRSREGKSLVMAAVRGNLARASLSLNLAVAAGQAASYPTAAPVVGAKNLAKALIKGGKNGWVLSAADRELINKYTPLLWYRNKGNISQDISDMKNGNNPYDPLGKGFNKIDDLSRGYALNWIQKIDVATVGRLWYAAEYYVDDNFKNLKKGTDAYYEEVAKVFNRVVEETQPNYTTMQRPHVLRSQNEMVKALTMFSTQRMQNFNILYDSYRTWQTYKKDEKAGKNGVTKEDVKQAKKTFVSAVASQIVAEAVLTAMKIAANALLLNWRGMGDDDDEISVNGVAGKAFDQFLSNSFGTVMGGAEVYEAISAIATTLSGGTYYGLSLNGFDSVTDIVEKSVSMIQKSIKGEVSEKDKKEYAKAAGTLLGIPITQGWKLYDAVTGWGGYAFNKISGGDSGLADYASTDEIKTENLAAKSFSNGTLDKELFSEIEKLETEKAKEKYPGYSDKLIRDKVVSSVRSKYTKVLKESYREGEISKEETISRMKQTGLYLNSKKRDNSKETLAQWKANELLEQYKAVSKGLENHKARTEIRKKLYETKHWKSLRDLDKKLKELRE